MRFDAIESPSQSSDWIVINTRRHREAYARENLERQGFSVYCPMAVKRIKRARRAYDASRAMFPSYLFVKHTPLTHSWRPILSTYGVRTIICTGDVPCVLDGAFVDALRRREIDGAVRKPAQPYQPGDKVAIQSGVLDGFIGDIIEMRGRDRIIVLLNLLNGPVPTQVSVDDVRAVRV